MSFPPPPSAEGDRRRALVVLGCRVTGARPSLALVRRLELCRQLAEPHPAPAGTAAPAGLCIVVSGGKRWEGVTEADAMRTWLCSHGVPEEKILLEENSHTTKQNAAYSARLLRRLEVSKITLVTSDFHIPRARRLFEAEGLQVEPAAAPSDLGPWRAFRVRAREWGARQLEPFEGWRP